MTKNQRLSYLGRHLYMEIESVEEKADGKENKKSNNTSSGTRNKILTSNKISTKRNVTNS